MILIKYLLFRFYNSHFDDLYQVGGMFPKENDTVYLLTNFTRVSSQKLKVYYLRGNNNNNNNNNINNNNNNNNDNNNK